MSNNENDNRTPDKKQSNESTLTFPVFWLITSLSNQKQSKYEEVLLTHLFPMHLFSALRIFDVFRRKKRMHWEQMG